MLVLKRLIYLMTSCVIVGGCATRTTPAPIVAITSEPNYVASAKISRRGDGEEVNNSSSNLGTVANDNSIEVQNAAPMPSKTTSAGGAAGTSKPATATNSSATTVTKVASQAAAPLASTTNGATAVVGTSQQQEVSPAVIPPSAANKWMAPTTGTVIQGFTSSNKGIDYSGKLGQPIYAVNSGKVVYSGDGLKGYGNLIIIKHDKMYLSAYAHNKTNLVREGMIVKRGQKIALMGQGDDSKTPVLHFEIRQNGKPIDPAGLIAGN
jgi:murein DD-endopeptidase MepM/ murein hydrolase activator NlpD